MSNAAWKYWVIGPIVAAALWAAGSSMAQEKAQPTAFNAQVAFDVYALIDDHHHLIGRTPSKPPLTIPPCQWW